MFAEFERDVSAMNGRGEALNADVLCKHYGELNKSTSGQTLCLTKKFRLNGSHSSFYYDFYVYQYSLVSRQPLPCRTHPKEARLRWKIISTIFPADAQSLRLSCFAVRVWIWQTKARERGACVLLELVDQLRPSFHNNRGKAHF